MAQNIGIMGGTFDPIHLGHLAAAEEARARFHLDRVVFVPNGRPPHRPGYLPTPAENRYDMVVLATASNPAFEVSRTEIDRPGLSYSADTVEELRRRFGPDTRIYFIAGADALLEIPTWRDPERLAQSCEFVAVSRPGYDLTGLREALPPNLLSRMHMTEVPGVHISSSQLRRRAAAGEPLRYLTPLPVERYIAAHGLYSQYAPEPPGPGGLSAPAGRRGRDGRRNLNYEEEVRQSVAVTLYVGNLPWVVSEDELVQVFSRIGEVRDVRIITDTETGRSRGFGFIEVEGVELQDAIDAMSGTELRGRRLTVGPGRPRSQRY